MTAPGMLSRMQDRVKKLLTPGMYNVGGNGKRAKSAKGIEAELEELGIYGVSRQSTDEIIAEWEDKLWCDQDWLIDERKKEWRQIIYYCSNEQFIAYHRDRKMWIPRRTQPWRIRSSYNVTSKAANLRVSRLTENKPTVTVVARKPDRLSMDKAEYKEMVWWHIWEACSLHRRIIRARRWATKTGSGFLIVGWDPDAGPAIPATEKVPREEQQPVVDPMSGQPAIDLMTGQPQMQTVITGLDEFYLDKAGAPIGPTKKMEIDPEDPKQAAHEVAVAPPEETLFLHEGEVSIEVETPFFLRWDRWVDELEDSWYVQRVKIMTASQILAMKPEYGEILKEAKQAPEDMLADQWQGLQSRGGQVDLTAPLGRQDATKQKEGQAHKLDICYVVRETWIFPKNDYLRKQWGDKGCRITTIGGQFCHKQDLPRWALESFPFIHLGDEDEEGNHYKKSMLRDVLPLQDDINRARSHKAERVAILSRVLLTAQKGHGLNLRTLGGMPAMLVEHRGPEFKPEGLNLGTTDYGAADTFYNETLDAVADVGHMNEATTGKLPSAGLAAKAIYALQYADERSIKEVSNDQDVALMMLARAVDAVTRYEYTEPRKIRIPGQDYRFLAEAEISPEDLDVEVDYSFSPGSMLSRNKEAIKNEIVQMMELGLIDAMTAKKAFSSAVPELFRQSYDAQVASARRKVKAITRQKQERVRPPQPWEDPNVHVAMVEEELLSERFYHYPEAVQQTLLMLWQGYQTVRQQRATETARASAPSAPSGGLAPSPGPGGQSQQPSGPDQLAQHASTQMSPPAPETPGQPAFA